jgi:hypothetical protein
MAGQRQQIDAKLINARRDLACRLRRVSVGEDAAFTRNTSNLGDGLQGPDLIVGGITEISMVRGVSACRTSSGSTRPKRSTGMYGPPLCRKRKMR